MLPEAVASDPERLARFEREAKVLASLNHPNIAAIYSFESAEREGEPLSPQAPKPSSPAIHFLVMELVDGDTLQELIAQGVAPDDALEMAAQVATALEAAHEQGVVHRDLKPANVKVATSTGRSRSSISVSRRPSTLRNPFPATRSSQLCRCRPR